jgi:surface protein
MFTDAISFNQPIGNWDISGVSDLSSMFSGASSFNQSLENWDVSGVTDMDYMFYEASAFNQPLENWDVSGVTSMRYMFGGASSFKQPINNWDVSSVETMYCMFYEITLSTQNYNDLLISWAELSLQQSVAFHGGYSQYTNPAVVARQYIIDTFSWTIIDRGLLEFTPPDLSSPDDISYEEGVGVHEILWAVGDQNPHSYNITKDGTLEEQGYWSNGSIFVLVGDLAVGEYEYVLLVNDDSGNMASDTVAVTVTEKGISDTSSSETSTTSTASPGSTTEDTATTDTPISLSFFIISLGMVTIILRRKR